MKNKFTSFSRYLFAFATLFFVCLSAPFAQAQQVGFYPVLPSATGAYGHTVGDLNNDGRDDLIAVRMGGSTPNIPIPRDGSFGFISRYVSISLISSLNATDGSFAPALSILTNLYTYQTGFDNSGRFVKQLADINGDGKLDAILHKVYIDEGQLGVTPSSEVAPLTVAFLGNGDGTFNPAYVSLVLPDNFADRPTSLPKPNRLFADMNGDGKADYIAPSQTGFDILIYFGNGSGGFSASPSSRTTVTSPANSSVSDIKSLVVADVNHDGLPDICLIADNPTAAFANEQSLHVMLASANGAYQDTIIDSFHAPTGSYSNLIAQHAKPNNQVALLLSRAFFSTQNVDPDFANRAYLGSSQGAFSLVNSLSETPAVFGDFDGDGIVDALTYAGNTDFTSSFRMNKGAGGGVYTDAGTFTTSGGNLSNLATLSGPHRFGSGTTPSVLQSDFSLIFSRSSLTPVVTRPGPQKQLTTTSVDLPYPIFSASPFTITAAVSGVVVPSGSVTFKLDSAIIGSASLINGVAKLVVNNGTSAGSHNIVAEYSGDSASSPSAASRNFAVDPAPLPKITTVNNVTVKEGQKALFKVSLSAATTLASSVRLSLVDVTTSSGLDYSTEMTYSDDGGLTYRNVTSGGTATIAAGVTSFLVRVTTLKDALAELNETYKLEVSSVSGLSEGTASGAGTIVNKNGKEKSLYDQVRNVADSATNSAESLTTRIKNSWMVKSFSGLFSWRGTSP
jgi:Bacterial Ig-like domain (group 3)/FG-GAP-like repeat